MNKVTGYIPALDGLRALSIIVVYAGHIGLGNFVPGGLGVTTFFFISGYIITNLLITEFNQRGSINLKTFYIRRVLRLYPALLLMLLLTTAFVMFIGYPFPYKELGAALFYLENYYFAAAHTFLTFHFEILWSLAVEEHFYLVFPFLLLALVKSNRVLLFTTLTLIVIALIIRVYISDLHNANEVAFVQTYILTHCRYDSILYGCLLSIFIHSTYKENFLRITTSVAAFCIGIALLLFTLIYKDDFFRQSFRYSLQGMALFIMIASILYNSRYAFINKILSSKVLVYIGKLSYSIYLFHFLAEMICKEYVKDDKLTRVLLMSAITIVLSLFSYHVVEVPIMKVRRSYGSNIKIEN